MGANRDPNFQRRSSHTGRLFEELCGAHLTSLGFHLLPQKRRIKVCGVKVDHVAVNNKGKHIYIECKGGYEGNRPGLIRTDNTKKMLANAFLLHLYGWSPLVVMTSAKPKEGSDSETMIKRATEKLQGIIFDIIELGNAEDRQRLQKLLDLEDFSRPLLPPPVRKAEVSGASRSGMPTQTLDDPIQIAWHSDPKLLGTGEKKRRTRKVGADRRRSTIPTRRKRKRDEDQIVLFEEE